MGGVAFSVRWMILVTACPLPACEGKLTKPDKMDPFDHPERWQSGRLRQTRNLLYGNVPGVRIPPSPPDKLKKPARRGLFHFACGIPTTPRSAFADSGCLRRPVELGHG